MYSSELLEQHKGYIRPTKKASALGEVSLKSAGISKEQIGINDPLAHVDQYMRRGEEITGHILTEFETDVAERLTKTRFINKVEFYQLDGDFVSVEGGFSMRKITTDSVAKMRELEFGEEELERAEFENLETDKLVDWFKGAEQNDYFIVESMPISDRESYAMVRIYQKTKQGSLVQSSVALHKPSIETFKQLRTDLGMRESKARTKIELLADMYSINTHQAEDFVEEYVNGYDLVLDSQFPGQKHIFGVEQSKIGEFKSSLEVVKENSEVSKIYIQAVKEIANSNWQATPGLLWLDNSLSFDSGFHLNEAITTEQARQFLDKLRQSIVATIDRSHEIGLLKTENIYSSVGHYGGEARAAGVRYESDACPTGYSVASAKELNSLQRAYGLETDPTKCVNCPGCKKTVDLPKDLYKQNVLHCVECKMTVTKDGKKINSEAKKILKKMYNQSNKGKQKESFSQWVKRAENKAKTSKP